MGGSTLPLAPDAFSGRMLGKYEVLCRLSTGGMAEIFLAAQRGLAGFRKLVVLKQILPDIKGEEEFVRMFLDEARVTAAFNHPNIAQVYDLDVADGELFLAMEFVQGATLVEVAKACRALNTPIPIGLSLSSTRDTALALHYAHTFTDPLGRPASVIHRDVAEKNIMVTYEGVTKLLDFGIAKNLARKSRTQVGMVKGTSGYMSPEQILGEPLDARSDLFSLGVVLHECLTGMRLFHSRTPADGAGVVLNGQVPPPSRLNKAVPPELDAIVLKALARKREDRYGSTLEFARALERAVGPLVWHPEQNAELIRNLFADRLAQTRKLLMDGQALSGETTSGVRVSQLFGSPPAPGAPAQAEDFEEEEEEPQTLLNLPAMPSALTAPPVARSSPPPPAPAAEPQKPPTPPRGAPAPRRSNSALHPTVQPSSSPESISLRRPVFEPLPQKRGGAQPPPPSDAAMPPPPPPEDTGNTQPGEDRAQLRPAWTDENATRAAPPEEPRPETRARPIRMDLHTMGTIPYTDGPPGPTDPPAEENDDTYQEPISSRPHRSPGRQRALSSERVSRNGNPPGSRAAPRRAPAPVMEEEEAPAAPPQARAYRPLDEEPEEPEATSRMPLPDSDEGSGVVTAPGLPSIPRRYGNAPFIALGVAVMLLVLGGGVVALGLDGGRISGLWAPAPTRTAPPAEPAKPPTPAPPTGATPSQAPAPTDASPAPATPNPSAPPTPTQPGAPPGTLPASATGPEAVALEASSPQEPEPAKDPEPTMLVPLSEEAETGSSKKPSRTSTRRPRREPKASGETAPVDLAPIEEKQEPTSTAAPSPAPGQLTLVTDPYAKVYLGKRLLGDTPLFKVIIPSGKHSLRLVGPEGESLRLPVEIKPGETTAVRIALSSLTRE
jgi:hypothetical protein